MARAPRVPHRPAPSNPVPSKSVPSGPARAALRTPDGEAPGLNLAVVWGCCSAGVDVRVLASGRRLASLSVRTRAGAPPRHGGSRERNRREGATSVPVTVWDPPAWLEGLEPGDPVVVVGSVRRRFFATQAGGRGTKAEVEAVSIARATPAQRTRAWRRATAVLDALG